VTEEERKEGRTSKPIYERSVDEELMVGYESYLNKYRNSEIDTSWRSSSDG
jgi:hypothetical protein